MMGGIELGGSEGKFLINRVDPAKGKSPRKSSLLGNVHHHPARDSAELSIIGI